MGLRHPADLEAWRRWDASRHRLRRIASVRRGRDEAPQVWLATKGRPEVAVLLESRAASSRLAFAAPTAYLASAAVYAPFDPADLLPGGGWRVRPVPALRLRDQLPAVRTVVAAGHYQRLGAAGYEQAVARNVRFVVVQHGLLTPFAPPLPPGAHLLAWSAEDADFWRSGRTDVTAEAVGSQLLWEAARLPRPEPGSQRPVFLGQLHGAELPRPGLTRAAIAFCRATGATYRPHPSELDLASRLQHRAFERVGIEVDRSAEPLASLARPVAAAFSTGVLEAAARGLPAWVFYPSPPAWLGEFWDRYGLSRWGSDPTPKPGPAPEEPARAVADRLLGH